MIKAFCIGIGIGILSPLAIGAPLIYEPFDYPSSPTGTEISTADGVGVDGWQKVPASTTLEPTLAATGLTYAGLPWTPTGTSVDMTGGATAVQASSTLRIPGQPYVSANEPTLYYSMLFRVNDVTGTVGQNQAAGGSFIAGFRRDTGTGGLNSSLDAGAPLLIRTGTTAGTHYQLGTGLTANAGTAPLQDRVYDGANDYIAGQTLLLVFSYQFVSGGEDFARMWVNPDPNSSEAANSGPGLTVGNALKVVATATDGHGINTGQITNFFLRNNGSAPDAFQIDELRVATSWEDVMSIPEPAGAGLLALGGIVLAGRSRRR
jgi:hypothetical protein